MIADDGYLKLIDYGFAKVVKKRTYTICGTPEYIAPEILLNKGHSKPVDWWTFGILIYEMHAGYAPFTDDDPMNIYKKIINTKPRYPAGFDAKLKSLVKHLLRRDLSKRYGNLVGGINDIKDHRFFQSVSFPELLAKVNKMVQDDIDARQGFGPMDIDHVAGDAGGAADTAVGITTGSANGVGVDAGSCAGDSACSSPVHAALIKDNSI